MTDELNGEAATAAINPWEITSVSDPRWFNEGRTVIKCVVSFGGRDPIEYAACSYDPEEHGRKLFEAIAMGDFGPVANFVSQKPIAVLPAVTLWERLTEAEADQVNTAMATQPFRTRQIFLTANTFRSDHELWPLLVQMATNLFGKQRADELLAS